MTPSIYATAKAIADRVVPKYSTGNYPCTGHIAKQWSAAYDAAILGIVAGEPKCP